MNKEQEAICTEDYQECEKCIRDTCMLKFLNGHVIKTIRRKDIEKELEKRK